MKLNLDRKLARLGTRLPVRVLRALLRVALGRRHLALVFHRVGEPLADSFDPRLTIRPEDSDAVIRFLLAACPRRAERWLSVHFDDGYEDAATYVESRARRFPGVDFIVFVCPEKAEHGAGFRWDLPELSRGACAPPERAAAVLWAALDAETENVRDDLRRVGSDLRFRLASVVQLRALAAAPNVSIGCHTNCHFDLCLLGREQARRELERSQADFERLFGPLRHFAFPFGHGFFDESHVQLARALGNAVLWGTGQAVYASSDLTTGAVVPRIVIDGDWGLRGTAAVIAGRSICSRLLGVRRVGRRAAP
jgi:Polysaccharide deacetylase